MMGGLFMRGIHVQSRSLPHTLAAAGALQNCCVFVWDSAFWQYLLQYLHRKCNVPAELETTEPESGFM